MTNKETLKKKIIYRSTHRGTKEMDILLGSFAKTYIDEFGDQDLKDLEKLLYIDDEIMLEQHSSELMTRIKQIQAQVAWIWYHAQNEDRGIMRQRIIQLLKTQ